MIKVSDYINKYVSLEYCELFWNELIKWDNSVNTQCFFEIDLLHMLLKQAKEPTLNTKQNERL